MRLCLRGWRCCQTGLSALRQRLAVACAQRRWQSWWIVWLQSRLSTTWNQKRAMWEDSVGGSDSLDPVDIRCPAALCFAGRSLSRVLGSGFEIDSLRIHISSWTRAHCWCRAVAASSAWLGSGAVSQRAWQILASAAVCVPDMRCPQNIECNCVCRKRADLANPGRVDPLCAFPAG